MPPKSNNGGTGVPAVRKHPSMPIHPATPRPNCPNISARMLSTQPYSNARKFSAHKQKPPVARGFMIH